MNKIKMYIVPDQTSEIDKVLSSKIKKFSSERNLFFANLNNCIYSDYSPTKVGNENGGGAKVTKSNSFLKATDGWRGTLIKKYKSTKDLFQSTTTESPQVKLEKEWKENKPINRINSFNLDEFDRHYLFSDNRRNIVKELRKNFENFAKNEELNNKRPQISAKKPEVPYKKCDYTENPIQRKLSEKIHSEFIAYDGDLSFKNDRPHEPFYLHDKYGTRSRHKLNSVFYGVAEVDVKKNNNNANVKYERERVHRKPPEPPKRSVSIRNELYNYGAAPVQRNSTPNLDDLFRCHVVSNQNCAPRNPSTLRYTRFRSGSANNVSDLDIETINNELQDFVDPQWSSANYAQRAQMRRYGSRKELDLEQKIDLEIKMREGSAKLLAACNNPKTSSKGSAYAGNSASNANSTQILEAAKNLLTSNERMTAYMAELQRRKRDRDTTQRSKPTGKVSLSEIRMPLMWRDTDHFKNKGDHRRFAVFCLAKIGTEIYDTSLLCPVDRNLTDITFSDAILFSNITPDFELKLEVYAVMMESDLSIASTPRKIKNTIHSSISRTVGKRLAANLKDELNNTKIGPKYDLIATAHLTLSDASDLPHTHDLCLSPNNSNACQNPTGKLPLFGHFCCRLAVQADAVEQPLIVGELNLLAKGSCRPVDGIARLQAFRLEMWDDEETMKSNIQPRRSLDVTRDTKLKQKGDTDFILSNLEEGALEDYTFRTKSVTEQTKWFTAIKKAIKEHQIWGHITLALPMQLASPGNKSYFTRSSRQGSLYDQVPIFETIEPRQPSRPSVQDIFAIPNSVDTSPTLSDFRNRTYSSGRSSHSSNLSNGSSVGSINSRRSHWPFGGK
ncbi:rhotekin-like isoform X1 [Phlebotomus argentipes]|uniref:rhotekin-like isoform X1 n=1 Tax=Phlebotomus argentipes TaxID=94469 RepID=UPI002893167F|nr:rhotekin-like isoform X1 [Phlebotomus argentipes]XP_059611525.1 rhotekin-like isoform X1 [Phlebotomus argentipes]XP_059611534.1 rhotekin-like isoform X1 [Phlebotomus argentipes]